MSPTVLLAPDKFKGSADAATVARSLAAGIHQAEPGTTVRTCPIADGGEGTVAAAVAAGWARRSVVVEGPTGAPVEAAYAVRDDEALVELAEASGLQRLPGDRLHPWTASTYGLGQTVRAAVEAGARSLSVGLGGSAGTDGGVGLLQALGARVLDRAGREVGRGAGHTGDVLTVDLAPAAALLQGVRLVAACDVTNPLLGRSGAAHVFGPQKGLATDELLAAEAGLYAVGHAVTTHVGRDLTSEPGAGAAGGAGFALLALGAEVRPGFDLVAEITGLAGRLTGADLVVTGEGRLDVQSLAGKGPVGVVRLARTRDVPALAVVGCSDLDAGQAEQAGFVDVLELRSLEPDLDRCRSNAVELLGSLGRSIPTYLHSAAARRARDVVTPSTG